MIDKLEAGDSIYIWGLRINAQRTGFQEWPNEYRVKKITAKSVITYAVLDDGSLGICRRLPIVYGKLPEDVGRTFQQCVDARIRYREREIEQLLGQVAKCREDIRRYREMVKE